jgi:hypothetical protein
MKHSTKYSHALKFQKKLHQNIFILLNTKTTKTQDMQVEPIAQNNY